MATSGVLLVVRSGSNDGDPVGGCKVTCEFESGTVIGEGGPTRPVGDYWCYPLPQHVPVYITVTCDGFVPYVHQVYEFGDGPQTAPIALQPVAPPHVDPAKIPLAQLARIRGAMWTARLDLPFGPRPGSHDNILATDFFSNYSPADQQRAMAAYKSRGYTHVVVGPIVDSDGYHGKYEARDWRGANFGAFLDVLQLFWDNELAPVIFIHPDGWTLEQTKALTPLFVTPRAQQLMRIVVPAGWEPARYEWSSVTWAAYGQWARETWPNALVLIHTVAEVDAPAGTDERFNDDDHAKNPGGNASAWGRVAPHFHGWLTQSTAFERPNDHGDPNHPDRTNFQNWQNLFNPNVRGSYPDRFRNGYAGWPTSSAWGPGVPLKVYAGEYAAFWSFWNNRPESESLDWGDAAIRAGADGYLDGGRVPV